MREIAKDGPLRALLVRYVLTGAVNTGFSFGIYCAVLYVGAPYPVAALISLIAGICLSFVTMGRIVFRSQRRNRFARFVAVWAVLYGVHVGLIWLLVRGGLDAYLAGLIASVPVLAISFLLQRNYVFR